MVTGGGKIKFEPFTEDTVIEEVIHDPAFGDFGRLLFPVNFSLPGSLTLREVSSSRVYLWYSHIFTEKTLDILNQLKAWSLEGRRIFFPIYTEEEMGKNPAKRDTGLFFFPGEPGREFGIMNAGGAFYYVGAMQDSFPHALEVSRSGCNGFALIYRPDEPYEDLARAIAFIHDHADELQVKAAAVIMQYTGYSAVSEKDAPVYACVGSRDGIANWRVMERRLKMLNAMGIPTEFHVYEGLGHGFGLGTGTRAEGWIKDAETFWKNQIRAGAGRK